MPVWVFAIVCFVGAEVGHLVLLPGETGGMPALWVPVGLLLGGLLLAPPRRWPLFTAVGTAAMVVSYALHGGGVALLVTAAFIGGGEAVAAAVLTRRWIGGPVALDRLTHSMAVIASALLVSLVGLFVALWLPPLAAGVSVPWGQWFLPLLNGILLGTPLMIGLVGAGREAILVHLRGWRGVEVAFVLLGAGVAVDAVFNERLNPALQVPAFLLPFVLWPAMRLGAAGSAAAIAMLSFVALWFTSLGAGPAAMLGAEEAVLRGQVAIALMAGTLYLLATIVAERRRVLRERNQLVGDLQQALMEIKTLQGLIPICAWCHKVRDDAGLWQEIEHYLDEHTDATFSHGICPACVAEHDHEIATHAAAASAR